MLLIRFWVVDEDTGKKKFGSPWFDYDKEKDFIDEWLNAFPGGKVIEQTKYVKENKK